MICKLWRWSSFGVEFKKIRPLLMPHCPAFTHSKIILTCLRFNEKEPVCNVIFWRRCFHYCFIFCRSQATVFIFFSLFFFYLVLKTGLTEVINVPGLGVGILGPESRTYIYSKEQYVLLKEIKLLVFTKPVTTGLKIAFLFVINFVTLTVYDALHTIFRYNSI